LEGKASEYYVTIVTQQVDIGFIQLMQKMEKRFGYKEIPDTAQLKLVSIVQGLDESMIANGYPYTSLMKMVR
jgi:hypothetical protein